MTNGDEYKQLKEIYDFVSGWLSTHYTMENNSRNLYLTVNTALIGIFTAAYKNMSDQFVRGFAIFGLVLSLLWWLRLARNSRHSGYYINILQKIEGKLYKNVDDFKVFTNREPKIDKSFGMIVPYTTTILMGIFLLVWVVIFIFPQYLEIAPT